MDFESSAPSLFIAAASPRKKKARLFSTSDVKIQLKHTDTGASLSLVIHLIVPNVPFSFMIVSIFHRQYKQIELDQSLEHLDGILPPFADEIPSD